MVEGLEETIFHGASFGNVSQKNDPAACDAHCTLYACRPMSDSEHGRSVTGLCLRPTEQRSRSLEKSFTD